VVAIQLVEHLESNNLHEILQSAYRKYHSVETALLKVHNDILCSIDNNKSVFLILLDLSAAFDTVNHEILLRRLENVFGIRDLALKWFKSYLANRTFFVSVEGSQSSHHSFDCGVPQGSVLGPILFLLYISPIADIIRSHGLDFHLYADDTQLYISFSCSSDVEMEIAKQRIEACVNDIDKWMHDNKLKLNGDKTDIAVLSAAHRASPSVNSFKISGFDVAPSSSVRNIGVIFDQSLSLDSHITSVCRACFFHLHNIWKIRNSLSLAACETLVHAFVSSKLDFCNSLLYGLPQSSIRKLQLVQNAAARLVTHSRKQEHITPILKTLHWLPVEQRIQYKLLLITFKSMNGCAPSYLSNLLNTYSPTRSLRSSTANLLQTHSYRLKTYGKRSFSVAAPFLWNSLPSELRETTCLNTFKKKLKTYLFKLSYS
jgi:hypothetical protein